MSFSWAYQRENGNNSCTLSGLLFDKDYVLSHFPNEIKRILTDYQGTLDLLRSFDSLANTDFERATLEEILTLVVDRIPVWRIGEAFAEFFLQSHASIRFWHNQIRDQRNPNCSPAGTDLLGFTDAGTDIVFVFGETKTSKDTDSPPQVLYGRTGLRRQIGALCTDEKIRSNLIRYLGLKVKELPKDSPFREDFEKALKIYIKSGKKKVHLLGLLVRDTVCNENDLKAFYEQYENRIDKNTVFKFLGLYIPVEMDQWVSIINGGNQ